MSNESASLELESPESSRWLRWTTATTVGLAPAALGLPLLISAGELPPLTRVLVLALLGAVEGLTLGWMQARVLMKDGLLRRRDFWIAATVVGSTIAWVVCALGMARMDNPMPESVTRMLLQFWGGHGVLVGLAQWAVLRHEQRNTCPWPVACGLAWMVGEQLTYSTLVIVAGGAAPAMLALPRLLMGLMIGAITAICLVLVTDENPQAKERRA